MSIVLEALRGADSSPQKNIGKLETNKTVGVGGEVSEARHVTKGFSEQISLFRFVLKNKYVL